MKGRTLAAAAALLLCLATAAAVLAAVFTGWTGPVWNAGANTYTFTGTVDLGTSEKTVCMELAVTVGGTTTTYLTQCTCTGGDCTQGGLGDYSCTTPDYSNATIVWTPTAWTAQSDCTGTSTRGPSDTFDTGANAVALVDLAAEPIGPGGLWLAAAGAAAALAVVVVGRMRGR